MTAVNERWLVAAWPGIGQVATTAVVYLLSMLRMRPLTEFRARGLFDLESVDVKDGILTATKLPRSRLFLWKNPRWGHDIAIFLGEAQPPNGKLTLCERLISEAKTLGVTRVFTFSALATDMKPEDRSRVFGVASDAARLEEIKNRDVAVLEEGNITGLNGIALAVAAEAGLPAIGLLGEMPALAPQLACPNASAAVLRVFCAMAGLDLDMTNLDEYGQAMQGQLMLVYQQVSQALRDAGMTKEPSEAPENAESPTPAEPAIGDADSERVERLFREARDDRSKAFELKKELDRLGAFHRYEDRFLDLFEDE